MSIARMFTIIIMMWLRRAYACGGKAVCEYLEGVGARLFGFPGTLSDGQFNGGDCRFYQETPASLCEGAEMLLGRASSLPKSLTAICKEKPLKSPLFFGGCLNVVAILGSMS